MLKRFLFSFQVARRHPLSFFLRTLTFAAILITLATLGFLILYILLKGIPFIRPSLFSPVYNSENVSLLPSIFNTLLIVLGAILIAGPLGIFSAIYMVEYARKKNKFVAVVRLMTETLSGIPSIVYGLFGMLLFVSSMRFGYSLISGILTVSIMILPLVIRTAEEALLAVPDSYREAAYGLGAGKLRTVISVVLPTAVPGILAGIILSVGRVIGETAALIYTAGTVADFPKDVFSSGRTLSVHMYELSREALHTGEAFATAVVLILFVFILNGISRKLSQKIGKI